MKKSLTKESKDRKKKSKSNGGLTHKQTSFILKLTEMGSVTRAAESIGISTATYYLWNQEEKFKKELKEIRKRVLDEVVNDLSLLLRESISAYRDGLKPEHSPYIRIRAANSLVDRLLKFNEVGDLEERISRLEEIVKTK